LVESFKDTPPTHHCVIRFPSPDSPTYEALSIGLTRLVRAFRDKGWEWYAALENVDGYPHYHVLLIAAGVNECQRVRFDRRFGAMIRRMVEDAFRGTDTKTSVQPVRNVVGVAKYVAGDKRKGYIPPVPPATYCGKGRRLVRASKGFLSASRKALYERAKAGWKRQAECSILENTLRQDTAHGTGGVGQSQRLENGTFPSRPKKVLYCTPVSRPPTWCRRCAEVPRRFAVFARPPPLRKVPAAEPATNPP
jgi:hypothetical protein